MQTAENPPCIADSRRTNRPSGVHTLSGKSDNEDDPAVATADFLAVLRA